MLMDCWPHPTILCAGLTQETAKTALAMHAQLSTAARDDWAGTALLRPMLQGAIRCPAQAFSPAPSSCSTAPL